MAFRRHVMRTAVFLALIPAFLLGASTNATSSLALDNAVFVDATGAHAAHFSWSGDCNGAMTLTLAIHRGLSDDTRTVTAKSVNAPEYCGYLRCLDCPPVPFPFAWTLTNAAENVLLAGGGAVAYDRYAYEPLAWSLQGTFNEGLLEARGTLV
jgi:hypothetical protein